MTIDISYNGLLNLKSETMIFILRKRVRLYLWRQMEILHARIIGLFKRINSAKLCKVLRPLFWYESYVVFWIISLRFYIKFRYAIVLCSLFSITLGLCSEPDWCSKSDPGACAVPGIRVTCKRLCKPCNGNNVEILFY